MTVPALSLLSTAGRVNLLLGMKKLFMSVDGLRGCVVFSVMPVHYDPDEVGSANAAEILCALTKIVFHFQRDRGEEVERFFPHSPFPKLQDTIIFQTLDIPPPPTLTFTDDRLSKSGQIVFFSYCLRKNKACAFLVRFVLMIHVYTWAPETSKALLSVCHLVCLAHEMYILKLPSFTIIMYHESVHNFYISQSRT